MREGASIDLDDKVQATRLACWRHLWAIQRDKDGRDLKFEPRSCACWKKPHVPSLGCVCHLTKVPFCPIDLGLTAAPYTTKVSSEGPARPEAAAITQLSLQGWIREGRESRFHGSAPSSGCLEFDSSLNFGVTNCEMGMARISGRTEEVEPLTWCLTSTQEEVKHWSEGAQASCPLV